MNEITEDGDTTNENKGKSGWRKAVLWLVGAALLAIVGYRGALGTRVAGATPAITGAPSAEAAPPAASTTGRTEADPPMETPPERASPAAAATGDTAGPVTTATPAASGTARAGDGAGAAAASPAMTADGKVILNLATEVELRKLPGIGKARARAIVEQRQRVGKFRRLEDLLRVKGIGPKRLVALRPKVVLDPP